MADAALALEGLIQELRYGKHAQVLSQVEVDKRGMELKGMHAEMEQRLEDAEEFGESLSSPVLIGALRRAIHGNTPSQGKDTLVLNEGISNYPTTWAHLKRDTPGSMLTSGGSSLGWGIGCCVGAVLGTRNLVDVDERAHDLVVSIVGDGSFVFGVPTSVFWMARRYGTPFLTIILNNGGWKVRHVLPLNRTVRTYCLVFAQSPKLSMLGVYPHGDGSSQSGARLSVGFGPECPDYSQVAVAASAGWAWGRKIPVDASREVVEGVLAEAVRMVVKERRCAVIDCVLESI